MSSAKGIYNFLKQTQVARVILSKKLSGTIALVRYLNKLTLEGTSAKSPGGFVSTGDCATCNNKMFYYPQH